MSKLSPYIKLCQEYNCSFRIVSDEGALRSPLGLIYVSSTAVNETEVDVAAKYPLMTPPEKEDKKPSLFKKLFS